MFKSYSQNRVKNLNRDVVRYLFFYFFHIFFFILSHSVFRHVGRAVCRHWPVSSKDRQSRQVILTTDVY